MSGARLRETFNRLLKTQFAGYLKKGAAAALVGISLIGPAAAHHNDKGDLRVYDSNTRHSRDVRSIQQEFNRAVTDRKIILLDRDWIEINRALNDVRDNQDLRNRYLTELLVRSGRLHINQDYFNNVLDNVLVSPHSESITVTGSNGQALRACLVYGGTGDEEVKERIRQFIDVSRAIHGDDFYSAPINTTLDEAELTKLINYHEIGHCMDDWFLPGMSGDFSKNPAGFWLNYNRAESFGDVYGALLMARNEGVTDAATQLANMRLTNMALAGPFQVEWSRPGTPGFYASMIYATHHSLNGAQAYIDRQGVAALRNMSYQELAQVAHQIVDQNGLTKPEFQALLRLYMNKFDMSKWPQGAAPDEAARTAAAIQLRQEMAQGLRNTLDLSNIPANQDVLTSIPFAANPYGFLAEVQARKDKFAALDPQAQAMAATFYTQAGGVRATIGDLLRVYTQNKDRWRAQLDSGTETEKLRAMENLSIGGKALWYAAHKIRGTDPNAVNDNAKPAPVPVPAPARP